eukprot:960409-Pelagomonas_calceolata.AAC.6
MGTSNLTHTVKFTLSFEEVIQQTPLQKEMGSIGGLAGSGWATTSGGVGLSPASVSTQGAPLMRLLTQFYNETTYFKN